MGAPLIAEAKDPFLQPLSPQKCEAAPAQAYAKLSKSEALAELRSRGVLFDELPEKRAPGVRAPVRLTGRLHGLLIHGTGSEGERAQSPFEIIDARLALSLYDFATILAKHDIDEIVHYTIYRPGSS